MMLPAAIEPRAFLGPNALSYSELSTLAHCEKKWDLTYGATERENYEPSDAMKLGTEMHRLLGEWWITPKDGVSFTEYDTAGYLIQRYDEHYGPDRGDYTMIATEIPFAVRWRGSWLFGFFDGLLRDVTTGEYWLVEFKTMSDWSRLNQLPQDKQISFYLLAASLMGLNVQGVMFDAIKTYKWVKDRPAAESFERHWVRRTPEQLQEFQAELYSSVGRRDELSLNLEYPIRNVGKACDWCSVMPECYGIQIDLLDTDADPL